MGEYQGGPLVLSDAEIAEAAPHDIDPCTGDCRRCEATREEMADGLVPSCFDFPGPHREALIALSRKKMTLEKEHGEAGRLLELHETNAVHYSNRIRELAARIREIDATIRLLTGSPGSRREKTAIPGSPGYKREKENS